MFANMSFRVPGKGGLEAAPERGPGEWKLVILGPLTPGQVVGDSRRRPSTHLPRRRLGSPLPHLLTPRRTSPPPRHLRGRSDLGLCPAPQPCHPAWHPPPRHEQTQLSAGARVLPPLPPPNLRAAGWRLSPAAAGLTAGGAGSARGPSPAPSHPAASPLSFR